MTNRIKEWFRKRAEQREKDSLYLDEIFGQFDGRTSDRLRKMHDHNVMSAIEQRHNDSWAKDFVERQLKKTPPDEG